jgi:ribosomal-protein-alanine N-acetyltransferase
MTCLTISDIGFKPLTPGFLAQILNIEDQVHKFPWSAQDFIGCFSNDLYQVTGVFRQNQLLGYAVLMMYPPEAELHALAIDRSFQNRGVGQVFVSHLVKKAADSGIERIYLEVREDNVAAIKLYKNSGFIQTGVREDYYRGDTHPESALLFRLDTVNPGQAREDKN